jgi:Zn-dependent peptidase ImmA (M78 family)
MLIADYLKSEKAADTVIGQFQITEVPVPIFEIAAKMDLQLIEYNLGSETSGVLVINNGKGTIGYNPKDPLVRRRFTIAHELGHYLMHKESNELFVDSYFLMKYRGNNSYSDEEYKQEQEANAFAAALLMPKKNIEKLLRGGELNELSESALINKLAAKFEVSVAAMSFRLTNLNMF